jgi:cellulose synthase/poly-beta-1,6-N-acetylglucosamine synthase-like glycosyltransferase
MNGPILSIITVNFNNNLGLLKTLESVSSQSFSSYEHIIIDAGSTDGSRETIIQYEKENPHLSFWSSESDKGIYDGMNKGIDHAKGQYQHHDILSHQITPHTYYNRYNHHYQQNQHRELKQYLVLHYELLMHWQPEDEVLSHENQKTYIHHTMRQSHHLIDFLLELFLYLSKIDYVSNQYT